ncbi:MAG: DUF5689 domain-containing protein [Bacteroidota bacterium]|nr:DUF5689 domain-containing protein [Bacteroidota bacterium]
MKRIAILGYFVGVLLNIGCANNDDYAPITQDNNCMEAMATIPVSELVNLANNSIQQYNSEDIIEGYVTSSDQGGNIYKTISVVSTDQQYGFSIPVDGYNLYTAYPVGQKVYVNLKDLYYKKKHGALQIGSNYNGDIGRLSMVEYKDVISRACETPIDEFSLINHVSIQEAKSDQYINALIELDGVQFVDGSIGHNYFSSALNPVATWTSTNHYIEDQEGNTLIVRVSKFAQFANNPVSNQSGKIRGVLSKYNNDYQLLVRTQDDIKLDNPRIGPVLYENFEGITQVGNNQFINLINWSNVSVNGGNELWEARMYQGNKYAQFSAFGASEVNVDAWLITPLVDLSQANGAYLSFDSKVGYANGEALTVWVSTNYNQGGTPEAISQATWHQLTPQLAPQTQNFPSSFTNSGIVDLSAYLGGNVAIAFRYQGSSDGITSTYQIDNIKIVNN